MTPLTSPNAQTILAEQDPQKLKAWAQIPELRKWVAQNVNTDASLLTELAEISGPENHHLIIQNPNISVALFKSLISRYLLEGFRNPSLALLQLEDPTLLADVELLILAIAKRSVASPEIVNYAVNSSTALQQAAVTNPNLTEENILSLREADNAELLQAVLLHVNSPLADDEQIESILGNYFRQPQSQCLSLRELAQKEIENSIDLRTAFSESFNPPFSEDSNHNSLRKTRDKKLDNASYQSAKEWVRLFSKLMSKEVQILIDNPDPNDDVIDSLHYPKHLNRADDVTLAMLASYPDAAPRFLGKLAARRGRGDSIVQAVARHAHVPAELLGKIARTEGLRPETYGEVSANPNIDEATLEYLLAHTADSSRVHHRIAENLKTPAQLLISLGESKDYRILNKVANHPNTPFALRFLLTKKLEAEDKYEVADSLFYFGTHNSCVSSDYLSQVIRKQEKILQAQNSSRNLTHHADRQLKTICQHPSLSPEDLVYFLTHAKSAYQNAALCNSAWPTKIAQLKPEILKDFPYSNLLKKIAKSGSLPPRWLKHLLSHPHPVIRRSALQNPLLSDAELAAWLDSPQYNPLGLQETLAIEQKFLNAWEILPAEARLQVLTAAQTPAHFLARLSHSSHWQERYAIAQNPTTLPKILENLSCDANQLVQAAAKSQLADHHQAAAQHREP